MKVSARPRKVESVVAYKDLVVVKTGEGCAYVAKGPDMANYCHVLTYKNGWRYDSMVECLLRLGLITKEVRQKYKKWWETEGAKQLRKDELKRLRRDIRALGYRAVKLTPRRKQKQK